MGVPSVYLWDCNSAGTIVNMFVRLADNHCYRWMEDYHGYRENYPAPIPEEEVFSESSHPSSHAPLISYTTLPSHKVDYYIFSKSFYSCRTVYNLAHAPMGNFYLIIQNCLLIYSPAVL